MIKEFQSNLKTLAGSDAMDFVLSKMTVTKPQRLRRDTA
jgi:hypothetical protein